jgi:hypothetical protein
MEVFVLCCLVFAATGAAVSVPDFVWPEQYSAEGTIYLPYAEIAEPFKAVVDMTNQKSRMDTYDGEHKQYAILVMQF